MSADPIQWFPGHMAKTRRLIQESLSDVDVVLELLDARIPASSRNPEIRKLTGAKPVLTLLTKTSLADPQKTAAWCDCMRRRGESPVPVDSITGEGIDRMGQAVRSLLAEKLQRYHDRGMEGRRLRAMMVGIPNVGKSSLINRLAGGRRAKVEDRPGVTMHKQWVSTDIGLSLLDMPGVLWPKFEDRRCGENLAVTGAIRDGVLDVEEIAMLLCVRLRELYPALFFERYRLDAQECAELDGYDLFETVGRRRGMLMSGGVINHRRTAEMLLDEFRGGKIGRITLEWPREEHHA